jgi:hypothetical protein
MFSQWKSSRTIVGLIMDRRKFLSIAGMGTMHGFGLSRFANAVEDGGSLNHPIHPTKQSKPLGSGHFGEWITDQFGLPAYKYTCNQISDDKAVTPVHEEWRSATDHTHQVGNDRLVAAVSNYGYVQVRQDEGAPKFLNDYCPERGLYGAGIGYLTDGNAVLSTYYSAQAESFERVFGAGYYSKIVKGHGFQVEQNIVAPFGDDPVLMSMVTVTNHTDSVKDLRWIEYWGCQNIQFSYRNYMQAGLLKDVAKAAAMRRAFSGRFSHRFEPLPNRAGLTESQTFQGRTNEDVELWNKVEESRNGQTLGFANKLSGFASGAALEDLNPPQTFLVSLDAPMDGCATDAARFFGDGGVNRPSGLGSKLNNDLSTIGESSAMILERSFKLDPNESRTICFLYGYLPEGFTIDKLVEKYSADPARELARSSAAWNTDGLRFSVPAEPWVEREIRWHNYYLRSNITYDSFFGEHIISQSGIYQYVWGFQGAARDPLQHTLPFIFTQPEIAKQVIRYTLKEMQPDDSIPYAIVGSGVPMPERFMPSDQEMWLLWTAAEYVLSTRDKGFLEEKIDDDKRRYSGSAGITIREMLAHTYAHFTKVIGVGRHGLIRMLTGDYNDTVVDGKVAKEYIDEAYSQGESVLNAAMATYVLDYYARMLTFIGDTANAAQARAYAENQRSALGVNWTGRWFRRAWLGPHEGWTGENRLWLEPQPWAIIGGAATLEQRRTLVTALNELVRKPSPIGAMMLSASKNVPGRKAEVPDDGGVSPSVNGTLIWALALVDGAAAWDEWKKNCLTAHAENYPNIWYGIWSGPDSYNSVISQYPGQTVFTPRLPDGRKSPADWGLNWTDFPVMNMHIHAWPLYSVVKLLGVEFDERGLSFNPLLPLAEYEFSSPLLGFKKSSNGYSGWYAPLEAGQWEIEIRLPDSDLTRLARIAINGTSKSLDRSAKSIRFTGVSAHGVPLRWELT